MTGEEAYWAGLGPDDFRDEEEVMTTRESRPGPAAIPVDGMLRAAGPDLESLRG